LRNKKNKKQLNLLNKKLFQNQSYILIKFDCSPKSVTSVAKDLHNNVDFLRSTIARINNIDEEIEANKCECKEIGKFVKSEVDYMKPMTVWNKKKIFKDYSIRL
jgi:hypothetical protein